MMTSTHGPLIKLALLILILAIGVILSVTIIAKETEEKSTVLAYATPFAKSLNTVQPVTRLEQQIQHDMNKLTPGHKDYDQSYVNSLLTERNEAKVSKVER